MNFIVVGQIGDRIQRIWNQRSGASVLSLHIVSIASAIGIVSISGSTGTAPIGTHGDEAKIAITLRISMTVVAQSMSIANAAGARSVEHTNGCFSVISISTNRA